MAVIQKGVPYSLTGDKVIMFEDSKKIKKMQGYFDFPTLSSWYSEDPERHHLGMQTFFGNKSKQTYGIMPDLLKSRSVINVGSNGTFTYDVPVYKEQECQTSDDTSDQVFPGLDGSVFKIILTDPFQPGDKLTYDVMNGMQIIVTEDGNIQVGNGFEHNVKLITNDKEEWFPASQLQAGVTYTKIGHSIFGEFGTNYSTFQIPELTSKITCEFQLGNETGVEAFITAKADMAFSGAVASTHSQQYLDKLKQYSEEYGDMAMVLDINTGSNGRRTLNPKSARLASTTEIMVRMELEKLTAMQLMWQKAGTYRGSNGDTIINEGLWHQLRRGFIIKYPRPEGFTKAHISDAVEYIFRGNPLPPEERQIMFDCGSEMHKNFMEIFRDEVNAQLESLKAFGGNTLLGTDGQLPNPIITGTDNKNLTLEVVAFTGVFLPGIGNVKAKRNYSLDYMGIQGMDRMAQGFHPYGKSYTTYSAIIWDANNQEYSNNKTVPEGSKIIEGGNEKANIYLVKQEGDITYTGRTDGRYYSPSKGSDIVSSLKERGTGYWAWNKLAIWLADPSSFVMIELDAAARRGYN